MTLLLMMLDRQTCLLQKSDLTVDQMAAAIRAGDWSFAEWENLSLSGLPRCVTVLDGLVVVSAASPAHPLLETMFFASENGPTLITKTIPLLDSAH